VTDELVCEGVGRKFSQIDFLSGPARPHRRKRRYDARVGIEPAQRIGLPALGAVRMEQKIVKIPENEIVVALGRPQAIAAGSVDLEKNLAIQQQSKKLHPRKALLPPEPADFCGVDSTATTAAIFGSQILNSAPARGDSRTISLPRRRRYANRDMTIISASPSLGVRGQ